MAAARLLCLLLAAFVLAPAGATAASRTARTPAKAVAAAPVRAAVATAERYWGTTPCGGDVRVLTRRVPADRVNATADAWARWTTPLGANVLAAPPSGYTDCVVELSVRRWPTAASMREDFDVLCMTVVHEFGHLLGRPHDDVPGSIMAPRFTSRSSIPAACRTRA